jgi:carbamoylphosphate synthase large subunit
MKKCNESKNILIGTNAYSSDWQISLHKINKKNIIIHPFENTNDLEDVIRRENIQYILPLSDIDYKFIQKVNLCDHIRVVYPTEEIKENHFTTFMLDHYSKYIPDVYYINNKKRKEIEYPAIYKPMRILYEENDFLSLQDQNHIQKYIEEEYEYSAYMLCINGIIQGWKVIRSKFPIYHIKKTNYSTEYENMEDFDIHIFEKILKHLNYSGGVCIDFKVNESQLYIFEINPRFGGSAFTCNFIP